MCFSICSCSVGAACLLVRMWGGFLVTTARWAAPRAAIRGPSPNPVQIQLYQTQGAKWQACLDV